MATQVAFLRAINVGNRRVPMDRLRRPFEDLGFDEVSTFIASGNVIFRASGEGRRLETMIEESLRAALGFDVVTFVRPAAAIGRILRDHPFSGDGSDDSVHVGFLKSATTAPVRRALDALGTETDTVVAKTKEVYWLARGGMGRATISGALLERTLGQPTTLRSLKMLRRLHAKLG